MGNHLAEVILQRYFSCVVVRSRATTAPWREHGKEREYNMLDILGPVKEIRLIWRLKPELRVKIIRHMIKYQGHLGVEALAKALNMETKKLYEIGGLEGWLRKRNCQRRQRRKRQTKKLRNYSVEATYEQPVTTGGGKRGKGGGLQDIGRRTLMSSVNGQ